MNIGSPTKDTNIYYFASSTLPPHAHKYTCTFPTSESCQWHIRERRDLATHLLLQAGQFRIIRERIPRLRRELCCPPGGPGRGTWGQDQWWNKWRWHSMCQASPSHLPEGRYETKGGQAGRCHHWGLGRLQPQSQGLQLLLRNLLRPLSSFHLLASCAK